MAMTRNPAAREVLNQVVMDPRYAEVMRVPLFSAPQIVLSVVALGLFGLSTAAAVAHVVPVPLAIAANLLAVYLAFTPLHDASHRAVSSNPLLNDLIGTVVGQLLLPCINMTAFRTIHMDHHRYTGQEGRDPDTGFVKLPRWAGVAYLMFADLHWVGWFVKYGRHLWSRRACVSIVVLFAMVVAVHVAFLASPWWKEFLLLYVVPQRLGLGVVAYTFAHIQHPHGLTWDKEPFQSTLYVRGNSPWRRLMFGQEEHIIHHLLPHVPWFKYKRVWDLANGVLHKQGIPARGWLEGPGAIRLPAAEDRAPVAMRLAACHDDAPGVRVFRFEPVDGCVLEEASAGSHVDVHLAGGLVRQYSVVEAGAHHLVVAVRRDDAGRGGSRAMHALAPGAVVGIGHPRNNFVLYETAPAFVLVAGGIGVTPLLAMAHRLLALGKPFVLHLCVRDAAQAPLLLRIAGTPLESHVRLHADRPDGGSGFDAPRELARPMAGTLLYICGPQGFMDHVRDAALACGWSEGQVRTESFGAAVVEDGHIAPFTLRLARSGAEVTVGTAESAIDALARIGFDVPFACMQGTCGTCIVPVRDGTVDHRDAYLTREDKAANDRMCLCVSRAAGASLTIDL